jgi:hypothetical protein
MSAEFFELKCHRYNYKKLFYFAIALECDVPIIEALFHVVYSELHFKRTNDSTLWSRTQAWFRDRCMQHISAKLGQGYPTSPYSTVKEYFSAADGSVTSTCIGVKLEPAGDVRVHKLCKVYIRVENPNGGWKTTHRLTVSTRAHLSQITIFQTSRNRFYYDNVKRFYDVEGGLMERLNEMLTLLQDGDLVNLA